MFSCICSASIFMAICFVSMLCLLRCRNGTLTIEGLTSDTSDASMILNIYDEPLKRCGAVNTKTGSWDSDGKCSETGGGVHQICIKNIANNTKGFSNS